MVLTVKDLDEIEKLVDEKIEGRTSNLPTKDDFFGKMDEVMGANDSGPCPMAPMCRGAMGRVNVGTGLAILGIVLLLGGGLVLLEPRALVWMLAGTSIVLGFAMLTMARIVGRLTNRARNA